MVRVKRGFGGGGNRVASAGMLVGGGFWCMI
jgi:hypothetical protein